MVFGMRFYLFFLILTLPLQVAGSDLGDIEEAFLQSPREAALELKSAVERADASRVRLIMDSYSQAALASRLTAYGTSFSELKQRAVDQSKRDFKSTLASFCVAGAFGILALIGHGVEPEFVPLNRTFLSGATGYLLAEYHQYAFVRGFQEIVGILPDAVQVQPVHDDLQEWPISAAIYGLFDR